MSWFAAAVGACVSLIRAFDNKEIAFACAFGLLLGGLAVWATCIAVPHRKVVRALRAAAAEARRIRRDEGIASDQRLAKLETIVASRRPVAGAWKRYRASIREFPAGRGEYVSPVDACAWFTPERLPGGGPEAWCGTLASVSLTLGLLLTFVGLSAGLFALGGGADPAALREGITKLLGISAAKFITSIAGLIAFIGWTLVGRIHAGSRERAAHDLAMAVGEVVPHLPPETLLLEQLKATQEAGLATRQLSSDLHVALDRNFQAVGEHLGGFRDALAPALDDSVRPVVEAIRGMSERIGDDNQAALQRMTQGFLGGIQDAAGAEMKALVGTLRESVAALSATKAGIGESGAEFGRSLQAAAERMAGSAASMAETMDGRLAALEARLRSFEESLSAGAGRIDEAGVLMSTRVGEGIERALQGLAAVAAESARAAQTQAAAGMSSLLDAMRELVGQVRACAERTRGELEAGGQNASAEMARAAATLSGSAGRMAETFDARMAEVEARMARLDAALSSGAGRLDEAGARMAAQVAQGVERAMAGLADAGAQTAETTRAQAEAGMEPVLAALKALAAEVGASAQRTRGELEAGGRAASEAVAEATRGMGVDLQAAAAQAGAAVSDAFGQGAKHLVAEMAGAAGRQNAASDAVARRLGELERSLGAVEQAVARSAGDLDRVGQTLATAGTTVAAASDGLGAAAAPVGHALDAVRDTLDDVRRMLDGIASAGAAAHRGAEAIGAASRAAESSFRSYAQRFEDTDRAFAATVSLLRDGVSGLNGQAVEAFATIDVQLSKALGSLKDAVEHMADVLADTREDA